MRRATHRNNIAFSKIKTLHLLIFFCVFIFIPAAAHAITYYVDAAGGNDSNDGVTIYTPWKTIAKVNAGTFLPGDLILFKKGCIWREQLTVPSSGAPGNPITFGAYGSGAKPVISGADIVGVNGWNQYSGNIYVTDASSLSSSTQLYVDGTYYDIAHYPSQGWLPATANSPDTTSIIDANLDLTADQIVGATVMTKPVPWSISTATAMAYDSSTHTITLNAPVYNASRVMQTGFGFYLRNKLWMLDSPKEWFYDQTVGKLYLWTVGGDTPGGHMVEASSRSYGVLISSKNYITIQDMVVVGANNIDVYIKGTNYITVNNIDIIGGQTGIYISSTSYASITNNSVQHALSNGIFSDWSSINNIDVQNNRVNNVGNVGGSPNRSFAGIYINGTSINIKNNTITNSGYIGIRAEGSQLMVQNNVIDRSCLVLDDCGGIYTSGVNAGDINKTISGNIVTNSIGNFSGTPYVSTQSQGIYLDDFAHDTSVFNNIVYNADFGIFIHSGYSNTVTGNSVYGARTYGLLINENGGTAGVVHDNIVTGNIFETIGQWTPVTYNSTLSSSTNFGTFNNNQYCYPNSNFAVNNQNVNYNLSAWRLASGQDFNSTEVKDYCNAPAPTLTLTASAPVNGSATLAWASTNAISCIADDAWSGPKAAASSLDVTHSGTYTLACSGRGGSITKSVAVTVPGGNNLARITSLRIASVNAL